MDNTQAITIYHLPQRMTLDQSVAAWLDEKRADSVRTADAYEETLNDFRETLRSAGLDLDSEPALVGVITFFRTIFPAKVSRSDNEPELSPLSEHPQAIPMRVSLAIGILAQLFHPRGELSDRRLAIDPRGIEGAMPKQRCQPNHIAGILRQNLDLQTHSLTM